MKLKVYRIASGDDDTRGLLFDESGDTPRFLCYTLEDEYRETKIRGETRIPAGKYELALRTVGGHHAKYAKKYGSMHRGMLWVLDVPNFEWILIHTGNTDDHTDGCLLVGMTQAPGRVGGSVDAYRKIYPAIADAILSGDKTTIEYEDFA